MRQALLRASGVDAATASRIETAQAPLAVAAPPPERDRAQMAVRSAVPLALVYLLLTAALITGGMMLQGVIEERSNRLLEAVLACVEPRELMLGKLIGLGAVGLTVLAAWVGCALLAAFAMQGFVADILRPSLAALNQPWTIALMIFYFFCGYLILAMAYLAIGSLSNSIQDAQAYLMPVSMAVLLPVMLMVSAALQNPDSWLPRVMSWIPLYTPFAMLARLGSGVGAAEIVATGLLLIVFVTLEIRLLGRVFTASLLGKLKMGNMSFSIADSTRQQNEDSLMKNAVAAFKARAQLLTDSLGGKGYRLVNLNLNSAGAPRPMPVMRMAAMKADAGFAAAPEIEAGTSQVTVTADGTIEVQMP